MDKKQQALGIVFLRECCVDGCYKRNTYKKDGKQMCKEHQAMYDAGEKLQAFYGRTVQRREFHSSDPA